MAGSALLGCANAGHWAAELPASRAHPVVGSVFVNHNGCPRAAPLEAVPRFVGNDLMDPRRGPL